MALEGVEGLGCTVKMGRCARVHAGPRAEPRLDPCRLRAPPWVNPTRHGPRTHRRWPATLAATSTLTPRRPRSTGSSTRCGTRLAVPPSLAACAGSRRQAGGCARPQSSTAAEGWRVMLSKPSWPAPAVPPTHLPFFGRPGVPPAAGGAAAAQRDAGCVSSRACQLRGSACQSCRPLYYNASPALSMLAPSRSRSPSFLTPLTPPLGPRCCDLSAANPSIQIVTSTSSRLGGRHGT